MDIFSSDSEKQERRNQINRARQGKRPKGLVYDYTDTAESRSEEGQRYSTSQSISATEIAESSNHEGLEFYIRPTSSGNGTTGSSREAERRHRFMSRYKTL